MQLRPEHALELQTSHNETFTTRRPTVAALEPVLGQALPVLDHGFIRVIDYMGDDSAIVQAARVSYGKGTKKVTQDQGLINYLMRHRHTTPFEMCELKLHIKLPIFVARQWIRHRTANVNEYSARYSILSKEFYLPAREHLAAQSTINNQGRGELLSDAAAEKVIRMLKADAEQAYAHYEEMLNLNELGEVLDPDAQGLARELARINLTLNYYTEWYWKIDLHNLLHFICLRADPHAQYEIRAYAEVLADIVQKWVPLTHHAFEEYRLHAATLSRSALMAVRRMIAGEAVSQENSGMTAREWGELMQALRLNEAAKAA
ncbi:MAG: FAD-dependent thymidylate synthase [Holosporales bacterium]